MNNKRPPPAPECNHSIVANTTESWCEWCQVGDKTNNWMDVNLLNPPWRSRVLAIHGRDSMDIVEYKPHAGSNEPLWVIQFHDGFCILEDVTHWQYLPELPK